MAGHWFFLSYAQADDQAKLVTKLKKSLSEAVRGRIVGSDLEPAFMDADLRIGELWSQEIAAAVNSCRVFVPIVSPTYFSRPNCVQEWDLFRKRLAAAKVDQSSFVVPIIWHSLKETLEFVPGPAGDAMARVGLSSLHLTARTDRKDHAEKGMRMLMDLNKYRDKRKEVIDELALTIAEAGKNMAVPALDPVPSAPDASEFRMGPAAPVGPGSVSVAGGRTAGPRFVQFVYVAATKAEVAGLRRSVEQYGERPSDWIPYFPVRPEEVEALAQRVAVGEKLRHETVPLGADLFERLERAEKENKIVAVIVDAWTLELDRYKSLIGRYDGNPFVNVFLLVPWNAHDEETTRQRKRLEETLAATFPRAVIKKDPAFIHRIESAEDLVDQLRNGLTIARGNIIRLNEVKKVADPDGAVAKPSI